MTRFLRSILQPDQIWHAHHKLAIRHPPILDPWYRCHWRGSSGLKLVRHGRIRGVVVAGEAPLVVNRRDMDGSAVRQQGTTSSNLHRRPWRGGLHGQGKERRTSITTALCFSYLVRVHPLPPHLAATTELHRSTNNIVVAVLSYRIQRKFPDGDVILLC